LWDRGELKTRSRSNQDSRKIPPRCAQRPLHPLQELLLDPLQDLSKIPLGSPSRSPFMFQKASLNKLAPNHKHSMYIPNDFCTKQRTCPYGLCSHEAVRMPTKRDLLDRAECQTSSSFCEPASPRHWLQRAAIEQRRAPEAALAK
jgi:hypothetical protein